MPTCLALGSTFWSMAICSSTGFMSEVPVRLPPGFSLSATRPEAA